MFNIHQNLRALYNTSCVCLGGGGVEKTMNTKNFKSNSSNQ